MQLYTQAMTVVDIVLRNLPEQTKFVVHLDIVKCLLQTQNLRQ